MEIHAHLPGVRSTEYMANLYFDGPPCPAHENKATVQHKISFCRPLVPRRTLYFVRPGTSGKLAIKPSAQSDACPDIRWVRPLSRAAANVRILWDWNGKHCPDWLPRGEQCRHGGNVKVGYHQLYEPLSIFLFYLQLALQHSFLSPLFVVHRLACQSYCLLAEQSFT